MPPDEATGAKPAPKDIAVIVTGAARGMGRAMTLGLAAAGVRVAAADLASCAAEMNEVLGTARRQGVHDSILPLECDITRWQDCTGAVQAAIDRFGAVHGLVNNAGIAIPDAELAAGRERKRRFYEHDIDGWRRVIETNVTGSFQMAKAIAPEAGGAGLGPDRQRHHQPHHHGAGGLLALRPVQGRARGGDRDLGERPRRHRRHGQRAASGRGRQHAHGAAQRSTPTGPSWCSPTP